MHRGLGILLASTLLIAGCAATTVSDPFAETERLWPDDPASARIALIGEFAEAADLGIDPNRQLLVTDSLNFRLQRFDADGKHIKTFGIGGDKAGNFARPKGVATDSVGHVYVVDALFHTIQIFDADGRLLLAVGEQGQGKGQFWLPNGIFIGADNTIYVADAYNRRVQVFRYLGPST